MHRRLLVVAIAILLLPLAAVVEGAMHLKVYLPLVTHQGAPAVTTFPVVQVIDGDTVDVQINGVVERLRLIGIDTPETVDPSSPVQCYGPEASARARDLLEGSSVSLEADPSQGERDIYGRLLRYVYLPDGSSFNLRMIADGYAHEYTYGSAYKYQAQYRSAEADARANNRGLWGACTVTPSPEPEPTTDPRADCHQSYPTICLPYPPPDLDCGDISYRRFTVIGSDPHRLDGDNDGIGCES